jgi:hypothetical protein
MQINEFYNFAVDLTKTASWQTRLANDRKIILDIITLNCKNNIYVAAKQGRNCAHLLIYEKSAQFRGAIPIHDFIDMSNNLREKFATCKLEPVLETLEKFFKPFTVHVRHIADCDFNETIKKTTSNIIIVSVSWI